MRALATSILALMTVVVNAQYFNWALLNSGSTQTLNDLFFTSSQVGFAVGVSGTILKTSNGGATWLGLSSSTSEPLQCIYFVNDSIGFVGGGSSQPVLLKTTNGGNSWSLLNTNTHSGSIVDIAFATHGTAGFMITADSIYYSNDGGQSWQRENYGNFLGTAVNSCLVARSPTLAFVGGRRFQTGVQDSSPEVYDRQSGSSGVTWEATTSNQFNNMDRIESLAFSTDSTAFAGGIQGKLYRLDASLPNVGGPWSIGMDLGSGNNQTINAISFANKDTGMFSTPKQMGGNSYSLIYQTLNNGNSWPYIDTISNFLINKLHYVDALTAYAVGNNGKIYKATHQTTSYAELDELGEMNIFPNPVTDVLQVHLLKNTDAALRIVDLSGRTVITETVNKKQMYLNVEPLKAGIYLLVIETKSGQITAQRFVKR
jgi:photosystem II stability/assembly factor-like uncharacterized protein